MTTTVEYLAHWEKKLDLAIEQEPVLRDHYDKAVRALRRGGVCPDHLLFEAVMEARSAYHRCLSDLRSARGEVAGWTEALKREARAAFQASCVCVHAPEQHNSKGCRIYGCDCRARR